MRARKRGTIVNVSSMDGIASLPVNGYYSSSKFALEGLTKALWQDIEPIGLRAILVEPGSFRTGIAQRTKFSGVTIDDYAPTSGAFRAMMGKIAPEMFPGDPVLSENSIGRFMRPPADSGSVRRRGVRGVGSLPCRVARGAAG